MVLDHAINLHLYRDLYPGISMAIDYIQTHNLSELPVGRHDIIGDEVFVLIQEYSPKEIKACKLETHRQYIDIQLVVTGSESIGYKYNHNLKIAEGYSIEKDVTFYDENCDLMSLSEKMFAIFFPHDAHMPGVDINASETVKKAVIKVKVKK